MRTAPAVSCACAQRNAHTSIQGSGGNPTFPAQWLYGLYVISPVIGFLVTVAPKKLASQELDASVEASEPHDFTVRIHAVRQRRIRVHRSLSHVRDDGRRPSSRDRMAIDMPLICPTTEAEYF